MSALSQRFIFRPIGTVLLCAGLIILGLASWFALPVASLPNVEFPTIRVLASRPGADPSTMAATVAAPLERALSNIAGITEMTSSSTLGTSAVTVQFDLSRKIDMAARDVRYEDLVAAADVVVRALRAQLRAKLLMKMVL